MDSATGDDYINWDFKVVFAGNGNDNGVINDGVVQVLEDYGAEVAYEGHGTVYFGRKT